MFTSKIVKWHRTVNDRMMPWKGEKNPYKIWLSEVILQQTRVQQGLAYYEKFLQKFPRLEDLALAADEEVFKLWEGLGYYSRCRNLIFTARYIHQICSNTFPSTYEDLIKLKGVGHYTAAAIASFAYGLPHAVVDGNVTRVLARFYGNNLPIDSVAGKKYFHQLAQELLYKKDPALYNQAIMDFGATVCKPKNPLCNLCVLQSECIAYNTGTIDELPVKEKKISRKNKHFYYFIFFVNNQVLVNKRSEKDIWQDLYEFCLYETTTKLTTSPAVIKNIVKTKLCILEEYAMVSISPVLKQQLTHQNIEGIFVQIQLKKTPLPLQKMSLVNIDKLSTLSFPKMINQFLEKINLVGDKKL